MAGHGDQRDGQAHRHGHGGHGGGHGHGHRHGAGRDADRRLLAGAITLLSAFLVGEVVAAVLVHSLALASDSGHMLADVGAIGVSLWTMRLSDRPAAGRWTYGWKRAEILSAAGNAVLLLVVSGIVLVEAVRRLVTPAPTKGLAVTVVALVGVVVNVLAAALLARADRRSLNLEGALRHVLTDLYGFLATVAAGLVIAATGFRRADSIASLVVVGLMIAAAVPLLHESGRILLEVAPREMDLAELRVHLLAPDHVVDVHDLHVWTLTSDLPTLSAHVVLGDQCFADGHAPQVLDQLQACLVGHFDLEHSTFQLEPASHAAHEPGRHD